MKTIKTKFLGATAAALLFGAATGQVQAQNTNYTPGDLVLFFQNPNGLIGGTQQVFASLGNTALVFRDATAGSALTLLNINTELTSAYGPDWASATTLYGGAGGVWGNAGSLSTALQNADPNRTIYTTQRRSTIGTVGSQNSVGYSIGSDGAMTSIANSILAQNNILETGSANRVAVITAAQSPSQSINLQNPVGGNGWNNNIPGDVVQQGGRADNYGTFGTYTDVEFMWDLYRLQAKSNIANQYGFGDPLREGEYLGTMTLSSNGDVGFTAVPEPSTYALLALAAVGLGAHVLRRRQKQS
jgi:hypothetical protein